MPNLRIGLPIAQPPWLREDAIASGPWEDIGHVRLGSAATSVSFASIPAAFVMFRLYAEVIIDNANGLFLRLNNDSGANYSRQYLLGSDISVLGARATGATSASLIVAPDTNTPTTFDAVIAKPIAGAAGLIVVSQTAVETALRLGQHAFIWSNTTDLINRIDVSPASGNFAANSLIVLQGSRF